MRYYLDTNMLIFILQNKQDDIHYEVKAILKDFTNVFYASSIAVAELLFLFRIGKIELKSPLKTENDILKKISDFRIQTVMFSNQNFETYLSLQIKDNHKDMKDHLIISQAISDKITLISSDKELDFYENQKLKWIYNKR